MNNRNTPSQGIGLNYLVEFLQFLQLEQPTYQVYDASPYKSKQSTLKLIKWCMIRFLITRREDFGNQDTFKSKRLKRPKVFYHITEKGRDFLRVIQ